LFFCFSILFSPYNAAVLSLAHFVLGSIWSSVDVAIFHCTYNQVSFLFFPFFLDFPQMDRSIVQLLGVFVVFALVAFQSSPRVYNFRYGMLFVFFFVLSLTHFFSAGPASLPLAPMQVAQKEFLDYHGNGAAIFEMSHRDHGGPVQQMIQDATTRLKLGLFPTFSCF
jgi:hypothetical protein